MKKKNFLLIISVFLNLIFIFFLVDKIQSPAFKELSDDVPNSLGQKEVQTSPQVIGEEKEVGKNVAKVIDGDTIVLESGETIRYIGIDAPEVSLGEECFAKEATKANEELVLGKEIRLEKDVSEKDKYNRLLRYVWVGSTFVNESLVKEGFARFSSYPPDVKYQDLFKAAEQDARENNRGLWGKCVNSNKENVGPSLPGKKWDCSANIYNCSDFKSQSEAQAVFEACGGLTNDIHRLDNDKDGKACESLP